MDFKHKLLETKKDTAPTKVLPRLMFICTNNHVYPITDETTRETLFKQHSKTGGAIKTYRAKQEFEHTKIMELKLNFMYIVNICMFRVCWRMFKTKRTSTYGIVCRT